MSNIAVQGGAGGTGTVTLLAPSTSTDRTLTLPDQTATVITDSAGILNIGSGQVYKDASGNLLVGTTSSAFSGQSINGLGVSRAGAALLALNNASNTNKPWSHFIYDSGLGAAGTYSIGQIINGSTGGLAGGPFTPVLNIAVPSSASNSPKVFIDSSGNVGVGTSSPNAFGNRTFEVSAGANSAAYILLTTNSNTIKGEVAFDTGTMYISTKTSNPMVFRTVDAERMRIDTSGNVGIGTSSPDGSFKATIAGQGLATTRVNIGNVAGFSDGSTLYLGSDGTSGASWTPSNANYRFGSNRGGCVVAINPSGYTYEGGSAPGTRTFAVNANGNVQNTNNSYGSLSDAKLKENVTDATPKLESLMLVKVRNFNLISDEAKTKQIGVVAQELEEVFPSMIDEHIDYTFESYVREDGVTDSRSVPTGTVTKEVKYSVFVPMLIKAIQEQQALITQLQADVAALKGTT